MSLTMLSFAVGLTLAARTRGSQPAAPSPDQITIGDIGGLFALGGDGGPPDANVPAKIRDRAEGRLPNLPAGVTDGGSFGRGGGSRGTTRSAPGAASVRLNGPATRSTGIGAAAVNTQVVPEPSAYLLPGGCLLVAISLALRRRMCR